jgi:hypothetical protein
MLYAIVVAQKVFAFQHSLQVDYAAAAASGQRADFVVKVVVATA